MKACEEAPDSNLDINSVSNSASDIDPSTPRDSRPEGGAESHSNTDGLEFRCVHRPLTLPLEAEHPSEAMDISTTTKSTINCGDDGHPPPPTKPVVTASNADTHKCGDGRLNWSFLEDNELFGRQEETELLNEALSRRLTPNNTSSGLPRPELILISGMAGSGKTALAQATLQSLNIRFAMGKFDQLKRLEPYAPWGTAMTSFLSLQGLEEVEIVRTAIADALKDPNDIDLLTHMIPTLPQILHNTTTTQSTSPLQSTNTNNTLFGGIRKRDPQGRLKVIFTKFIRACCSFERPLVLVLDDLQWADAPSLELLETIAADWACPGLALVGICRSTEVALTHDLAVVLRRLEDELYTTITNISVGCLSLEATRNLVSAVLQMEEDSSFASDVSDKLYTKTEGNVFFMVEFLKALQEAGVLDYSKGQWVWNNEAWTCKAAYLQGTTSVVDLVVHRIERLPEVCRLLLSVSACLGANLDEFLLLKCFLLVEEDESIYCHWNYDLNDIQQALDRCSAEGVIVQKDPQNTPAKYHFFHDRIQQASYYLIPEAERTLFHLVIGRKLIQHLTDFELEGYIFVVVDQMMRGVEHIQTEEEKVQVAALCLQASQKAVLSSDFRTAIQYLEQGDALLDQRRKWIDYYELTLNLSNTRAETYCCIADFDNMDKIVTSIFLNARCLDDKLQAYMLRIFALGSTLHLQEAIQLGLDVLGWLGEAISKRRGLCALIPKFLKVQRMLAGKTDQDLLNLPDIKDPKKLSAMGVLNLLVTYCYIADQALFPFIALRMVKVSLKYGLSAISSVGFTSYGLLLCAVGDFDTANRFGQLSLSLLKRYNSVQSEWIPRCYMLHYGIIAHWKQRSRSTFKYLEQAHQMGLESGDIEYAWIAHYIFATHCFSVGESLPDLEPIFRDSIQGMKKYKQEVWAELALLNLEATLILMGKEDDPIVVNGALLNVDKHSNKKLIAVQNVANMNFDLYVCEACVQSMMAHYHVGDLDHALAMAKGSQNASTVLPAAQLVPYQAFYDGLTSLTILRQRKPALSFVSRRRLLSRGKRCLTMLQKFLKHSKENFYPRVAFLEAEFAALSGKLDLAMSKYALAENAACREGNLDVQGLAAERAAVTLQDFGCKGADVAICLERAITVYSKWGAWAVVERVKTLLAKPCR